MMARPQSTPPPGASVDYNWYESGSPNSPVEQQVYFREATVGATATGYHPAHTAAFGSRSTGMTATSAAPNIYNLSAFPLPNGEDRSVGMSSYPVASQHHHYHHHMSEHGSSLPHHNQTTTRQSLQYHHYHPHQQRANGMPEKERLRRVSSPEMQMQPPPHRAPRGAHHVHSSSSSTHYSKVVLNERGKQVQRRSSDRHRERPASVGTGERRTNYQRVTAQRSDSSLQYNSLDRGLIYHRDGGIDPASLVQQQQQTREWVTHQLPPSGSEMRSFVFEEMNVPRKAYDSSEGYQTNGFVPGEHQHQMNAEEQRMYQKQRPNSAKNRQKSASSSHLPRRAVTPNPSLMHNRGEAWYIEEEDSGVPLSPTSGAVTTVGHMDHALLPQKLYFSTSPPPPPSLYHTSSSSQPTTTTDNSGAIRAATPKCHSIAEPPSASGGSPSHSRSGSSEGHSSSRRSSRDSGRMVISPSHHHHSAHQTSSSVSSGDRSSASPVHISAYEQMLLNGNSRRSPSQQMQPRNIGRSVSSPDRDSPSSATRQIMSVVGQPSAAPQQGRGRLVSSPEAPFPSKYARKPHQYDIVKFPHSYEEVEFTDPGQTLLSRASTKSEAKLNSSKLSRFSRKGGSEKRPNQPPNMHMSDSRLNKITRRRASDKTFSTRKSPGLSKRFSTGTVIMAEGGEARRRTEKSQAFIKAKYRVSNPEPGSEMMSQHYPSIDEFGADGPDSDVLAEEDFIQDVFLTSGDFEQSDSDTPPNMHRRNTRSKSSGGMIIQKFSKKLSKLSLGGGGGGGKGNEGSGGGLKKKKGRTNSASNLESPDSRLTQSMEQLSPLPVDEKEGVKGFNTPGATPIGTPQMSRSRSKSKLARRSSEPDLEGALSTLFRSGSKKNLAQDAAEALFKAIEQDNADEVKRQLEFSGTSLLNMTNEDDFLPVDLAAMLNHQSIVRLLLERGGKDSAKFCRDPFFRFSRITALLMEAERELDSLKCELVTQNVGGNSKVKEDLQRRLREWEWKAHLLRKMKKNYEQANIPGPPSDVCLHVTSNRSLTVTFDEPEDKNGAMVTRYKIEWCRSDKFTPIVGDFVMTDLRSMEYTIPDLNQGEAYFVRVYAYNMKGFGPAQMAMPNSAVPSSWHDITGSKPRYEGATDSMQHIAAQLSNLLSSAPSAPNGNPSTSKTSKQTVKKSITKLFGPAVKFHKALKAGVYISSLVYTGDDKILTTVDDQIPIVEVSDSHSSNIGSDFVWLAKVSCTWKHIKSMTTATERYVSSPAVQFRHKLLCAVLNLQAAIGIPNLGLLHPIPFKDSQGAIVFVIVHQCKDPNSLQTKGSLKWSSLPRLRRKRMQPLLLTHGTVSPEQLEGLPVSDRIVVDAEDVIDHHKSSTSALTRGLYLGYLKGRSTVASMRVICSREYPNVLPHYKIRDNPNISSEEWEWLKSLSSPSLPPTPETSPNHTPSPGPSPNSSSSSCLSLQQTLLPAVDTFLHNLGIDKDEAERHQLYCHEVIELNEDITLLLVMPSHDQICTPPGSSDHFAKLPSFVPLPINTFEIMQLFTYQQAFMTNFSVVSARLEVEFLASQQRMREAFSNAEGAAAKKMHKELEDLQEKTELEWKQMRWIDDAVQKGRDIGMGTEILLPIKTIRETVTKQQEHIAKKQREITAMLPSPQHRATSPASGYLRVFPAYNTGLIKGTSVKLYITIMTTTSDVIRLVVHQLEKTRVERGIQGRMIMEDDLNDFYLVAISGNQEWVLNEDYNPLQLQQQPQAQKYHLYVRRRSEQLRFVDQVTTV